MKAYSKNLSSIVVVVLALSSMVACNKNDSSGDASRLRSGNQGALPVANGQGYYQKQSGSIVNSNMTIEARNFLVNGQLTAESIGVVDGNSGVTFEGIVRFDNSNRVVPSQSYITIKVIDDQALSGKVQPITVTVFNAQTTGSVTPGASYSTAQIRFQDSYGTIDLSGYFDRSSFTGDVRYTNSVTGVSGTLGQFRIPTCGFFVCL